MGYENLDKHLMDYGADPFVDNVVEKKEGVDDDAI